MRWTLLFQEETDFSAGVDGMGTIPFLVVGEFAKMSTACKLEEALAQYTHGELGINVYKWNTCGDPFVDKNISGARGVAVISYVPSLTQSGPWSSSKAHTCSSLSMVIVSGQ